MEVDAQEMIRRLDLAPHPEGGWYRETLRARGEDGARGAVTAIHFLLEKGQRSQWHRIDATEIWLYQGGGSLTLRTSDGPEITSVTLGPDIAAGDCLQAVVAPNQWQAAEANGSWCLVACVVAPAFEFSRFELAPPSWSPETAIPVPPDRASAPEPDGSRRNRSEP